MDKDQISKMLKFSNYSRKEMIRSQLDRLIHLESHGVIKYHEVAQMEKLKRELIEIEYSEQKRPSSNPPAI